MKPFFFVRFSIINNVTQEMLLFTPIDCPGPGSLLYSFSFNSKKLTSKENNRSANKCRKSSVRY